MTRDILPQAKAIRYGLTIADQSRLRVLDQVEAMLVAIGRGHIREASVQSTVGAIWVKQLDMTNYMTLVLIDNLGIPIDDEQETTIGTESNPSIRSHSTIPPVLRQ